MKCFTCNREFNTERDICPFCGSNIIEQDKNAFTDDNSKQNNNNIVNDNGYVPLIVSRMGRFIGIIINFTVYVDGVCIGTLKNGKSVSCQVGKGTHEVLVKCFEKNLKQTITVLDNHHSVEVITRAKMGLLAAVAEIKDVIYR